MPLTTQHAESACSTQPLSRSAAEAWSAIRRARPARPTCRECRPGLHAKLSTKEWGRRFAYRLLASPGTRLKPLAPRYLGESCRHLDHSVPLADHFLRGIVSILDFVPLT